MKFVAMVVAMAHTREMVSQPVESVSDFESSSREGRWTGDNDASVAWGFVGEVGGESVADKGYRVDGYGLEIYISRRRPC